VAWSFSEDIDPLTDEHWFYLSTPSVAGDYESYEFPYFFIRVKKDDHVDIFINWDSYLGIPSTHHYKTEWRIDAHPANVDQWQSSTTYEAAFYAQDRLAFLKALMTGQKLLVRITPDYGNTIMATFMISGLASELSRIPGLLEAIASGGPYPARTEELPTTPPGSGN